MQRDSSFDGQFVYAVSSTRIYCRPSCPSRKPKPENIRFFSLPELAQQAGYRACKRCQPDEAHLSDARLELVRSLCRYLEAQSEAVSLESLAQRFGYSAAHLQKTFTAVVGISPQAYYDACRMQRLRSALQEGEGIATATYAAGYSSSSQVYERANCELGMTPGRYRQKGLGTVIDYSISASVLGTLLIAATDKGICAVRLADSEAELIAMLESEFAAANLQRDDRRMQPFIAAVLEHLSGSRPHLDLPLDIQATAFQRRVWQELQKIPYGETRSYGQIAAAIGQTSAVRAVASACAKNGLGIVIPCHRVVRGDGSLSGYRWGARRKEALLKLEQTHSQT